MDDRIIIRNKRADSLRRNLCRSVSVLLVANSTFWGLKSDTVGKTIISFCLYILLAFVIISLLNVIMNRKILIDDECIKISKGLRGLKLFYSGITRCFVRNNILTICSGQLETEVNLDEYESKFELLDILRSKGIYIEQL